jgi:hypothetical protein
MHMSFNGINFSVRSQQLITSSIQREISVDSEVLYNCMNEDMIKFHDTVCQNRYKSCYNQLDVAILDEYRTVVNIGMIRDLPKKTPLIELDRAKAFTAASMEIAKVPVLNEFDIFKPYNNEEFKELSLYMVGAKTHNFFPEQGFQSGLWEAPALSQASKELEGFSSGFRDPDIHGALPNN